MIRAAFMAALLLAFAFSSPVSPPPSNLLLVTIDTLRADRLGAYGYARGKTPRLDELARGGFRFDSVVTPVPLTLPAHASLLTGRYPPSHGIRNNGNYVLPEAEVTLAEVLRERGYRTGAIVSSLVLDRRFGLGQGFQDYDDRLSGGGPAAIFRPREIRAAGVSDKALSWLESAEEPFFLWIHYFDPHADYDPPEPFRSEFSSRPYDGEVAYVDHELGRVFDGLRVRGREGRTLVAVVADHGEGLLDHGEATHGFFLYETTLRVPLILSGPGVNRGMSDRPASLVDLFPTLLSLLGIAARPEPQGVDLAPALKGEAMAERELYCETLAPRLDLGWSALFSVRDSRFKFIQAPRPELYDLSRDLSEEKDLAAGEPARAADYAARLKSLSARLHRSGPASAGPALDPEARQALMALGYTGGRGEEEREGERDPKDMKEVLNLLAESESSIRRGDLPEAERRLKLLTARDPSNRAAWERLVMVLRMDGKDSEALEAVEQAVVLKPDNPLTLLIQAELLRRKGDLDGAETAARRGLASSPRDAALRVLLAKIALVRGRTAEALSSLQRVLEDDPGYRPAWVVLAHCRLLSGDGRGAEEIFRRLIADAPADADARYNLGVLLLERGEKAAAREQFEAALRLQPGHALSRQRLNAGI